MKKIILLILFLSFCLFFQNTFATDYYVDSNMSNVWKWTFISPWKNIDALNSYESRKGFLPWDHIKFKRNWKYSWIFYLNKASGNKDNNVFIEDYWSWNSPLINWMIIIIGQKYITIKNLEIYWNIVWVQIKNNDKIPSGYINIINNKIHDYSDSGINIDGGWNNITASWNEIYNGSLGVYMWSNSGKDDQNTNKKNDIPLWCNNNIKNNNIYKNSRNGIWISSASLKEYASQFICDWSTLEKWYNVVQGNTVRDSGCHGIEIDSNYVLIERNTFTNNWISDSFGGCSWIHLFDRWPSESWKNSDKYERGGDYNIIRNNISKENKDRKFAKTDWNGIQLDMWCDHNQVYNNISYWNDWAGIILYGASNNEVYNNTMYWNWNDVWIRFWANEMVVLSASIDNKNQSDIKNSKWEYQLVSKNNIIKNNIWMAINSNNSNSPNYGFIDCRYWDCRYALAVDDYIINDVWNVWNNIFSNNLWFNSQKENQAIAIIKMSEQEHFQIPIGSTTLNTWNSKNWVKNDKIWNPLFLDAKSTNFYIHKQSPAIDNWENLKLFNDDFDGIKRPQWANWDIGAYECITNISYLKIMFIKKTNIIYPKFRIMNCSI